jgi:hypothetical protein
MWHALSIISVTDSPTDTGVAPAVSSDDTGGGDPIDPEPKGSTWIVSDHIDDGFGSAIVFGEDSIWIGAPHGSDGAVYRWIDDSLAIAVAGNGRLGSHLAWTIEGLWVSAPLKNDGDGEISLADGTVRTEGAGGTGIALSSSANGAYAWDGGWFTADDMSGETPARPTALHQNGDSIMGVGMAHGSVALMAGDRSMSRAVPGDEAGFSLTSADINGDGTPDWLIGAPGANTVTALDGNDLTALKVWVGTGRFGHAIAVCNHGPEPVDSEAADGDVSLIIGAPLAETTGQVAAYTNFASTPDFTWEGGDIATELGSEITCGSGGFAAGAPGNAHTPGSVLWVQGLGLRSP